MATSLTVAVAQPRTLLGDVAGNVERHCAAVRAVGGAELVVFPELSLTGYELSAPALRCGDAVLAPLVRTCADTGRAALVGAPVLDDAGARAIAFLLVTGSGARVAYRKVHLGAVEALSCTPDAGAAVVAVGGWRVALGICKDTGTPEHVDAVAALQPDLYVAGLVHHAHELAEQDRRGLALVRALRTPVAFASFAGATGEGYDTTAGSSTVWDRSGHVLARAGGEPGEVVVAHALTAG